jgi:DHA1 family bicyclomycin/chloramphenicol resistance-like MFS transporter
MTVLLCGRLLQAFGAGCSMVMTRAIARDVYAPDKLVKALAYLTMAYILGPMLAPPIGGALVDTFGWRSIFVVAALAGAVIFLLVLKVLAETRSAPSGVPIRLFAAYAQLSRNLRFLAFVMQSGFGSGAFFAQASAVTYLMQELLRRPASEFGVYFMFFPCSFWIGTFVASRMSGKVGIETMVVVGTGVMVAAAAALAGLMLSGLVLPVTLFAPGFFLTMGQGLSLPSSQTGALTSVGRELTGTASGVGAFLQLFVGAVFCQVVGFAADGTPNPMVVVVAVCTVVAFLSAHVPATIAPAVRPPSKPS